MFDFGFWEIALILIISLIILGPERLPVFASQFGSLVKKIKDFANNLKTRINPKLGCPEYTGFSLSVLPPQVNKEKKLYKDYV